MEYCGTANASEGCWTLWGISSSVIILIILFYLFYHVAEKCQRFICTLIMMIFIFMIVCIGYAWHSVNTGSSPAAIMNQIQDGIKSKINLLN